MTMTHPNRPTQQDRNRKAIAATQKYLTKIATVLVAGVSYTPAEIIALLQKDIDVADAATGARNALLVAAAAARDQRARMTAFRTGFRAFLENMFTDPGTVAEFGFTPRTRRAPTAETKAAAVDKRNATRAARHTMGPRQKAPIKGDVPAAGASAGGGAPPAGAPGAAPSNAGAPAAAANGAQAAPRTG
jgi:hypothetical protein